MSEAIELAAWRSGVAEVTTWAGLVGAPLQRVHADDVVQGVMFTEYGYRFLGSDPPRSEWLDVRQMVVVHDLVPHPDSDESLARAWPPSEADLPLG